MSNSTENSQGPVPNNPPGNPPDTLPVGAILAGGASRRMGVEKSLTHLAGKALLDRVVESIAGQVSTLILVGGPVGWAEDRGLVHRPDRPAGGRGPLAGLLAAFDYAEDVRSGSDFVFLTATDMPFLPADLVSRLTEASRQGLPVIPQYRGQIQPLAALWPRNLRDELAAGLDDGTARSMKDLYEQSGFVDISYEDAPSDPFFNVNTPEDLSEAEQRIAASR